MLQTRMTIIMKVRQKCSICNCWLSAQVSKAVGKCKEHRTIEDLQAYLKSKEIKND